MQQSCRYGILFFFFYSHFFRHSIFFLKLKILPSHLTQVKNWQAWWIYSIVFFRTCMNVTKCFALPIGTVPTRLQNWYRIYRRRWFDLPNIHKLSSASRECLRCHSRRFWQYWIFYSMGAVRLTSDPGVTGDFTWDAITKDKDVNHWGSQGTLCCPLVTK